MIKTEARKTWSDRVNFTSRNKFSWTFKVLKPLTPPGALRQTPGPHPCWASRQVARGAMAARYSPFR